MRRAHFCLRAVKVRIASAHAGRSTKVHSSVTVMAATRQAALPDVARSVPRNGATSDSTYHGSACIAQAEPSPFILRNYS